MLLHTAGLYLLAAFFEIARLDGRPDNPPRLSAVRFIVQGDAGTV